VPGGAAGGRCRELACPSFFTGTEHIVPKILFRVLAQGLGRCSSKAGYRHRVIFGRARAGESGGGGRGMKKKKRLFTSL